MNNLSAVLSRLMSDNSIKSAELARKTGIGQPVIHRLMTGATNNPQIATLKPIADFFGITIDELCGFKKTIAENYFDNTLLHDINNKLITIKTIASVLVELLPTLIEVYKKAISAGLANEQIPPDILPLLTLNCESLLKATNHMHEVIFKPSN